MGSRISKDVRAALISKEPILTSQIQLTGSGEEAQPRLKVSRKTILEIRACLQETIKTISAADPEEDFPTLDMMPGAQSALSSHKTINLLEQATHTKTKTRFRTPIPEATPSIDSQALDYSRGRQGLGISQGLIAPLV